MVEGDVFVLSFCCVVFFGNLTCINITFVEYVSNQSYKFYIKFLFSIFHLSMHVKSMAIHSVQPFNHYNCPVGRISQPITDIH